MIAGTAARHKKEACRETIPTYPDVGQLMARLFGLLERHGLRPTGPPVAIYHDPEYRERDVDMEVAVPVAGAAPAGVPLSIRDLPEVETMATVIHEGPYEGLREAYGALMAWIEANGYRVAGPCREIYLRPPEGGTPVTEAQIPVERA